MNYLILGVPGSGKSFVATYCKSLGVPAYDADYDIPGLACWSDADGGEVLFPETPTVEWLKTHHFTWNRQVLEKFLQAHTGTWVFGIAENAFEQTDLFDKSFYLTVTESVLRERLLSTGRTNKRGKTEAEVEQIWQDIQTDHLPAVMERGITLVDATRSPEEIVEALK